MKDQIWTRMGDGLRVRMSLGELKEDLWAGSQDAAERAGIPL